MVQSRMFGPSEPTGSVSCPCCRLGVVASIWILGDDQPYFFGGASCIGFGDNGVIGVVTLPFLGVTM